MSRAATDFIRRLKKAGVVEVRPIRFPSAIYGFSVAVPPHEATGNPEKDLVGVYPPIEELHKVVTKIVDLHNKHVLAAGKEAKPKSGPRPR